MRNTLLLVLLLGVIALTAALPKQCQGRVCRNLRPTSPEQKQTRPAQRQAPAPGRGRPSAQQLTPRRPRPNVAPNVNRPAPLRAAPPRAVPKRPAVKVPEITTPLPITEQPEVKDVVAVTEQKMVTDGDGNEVREIGVNGWLASPTPPPVNAEFGREKPSSKPEKPGSCDTPRGFGIKCMLRLDQCTTDHQCPGSTKCCMVGECGYLCVKPKPTSTEPKEVQKESVNKQRKGDKIKVKDGDLTAEASEISEAVELPEGALKAEDIIENPKNAEKSTAPEENVKVTKEEEEEEEKEVIKTMAVVEELIEDIEAIEEAAAEAAETTTVLPDAAEEDSEE